MQISIENTGTLGRRMTVAVPAATFEQEFSARLKRLCQSVKLPGFRPGKVPAKMVEAQYGSKLLQEVAGDLIQKTFYEAAGKEGLRPAAGPTIEPRAIGRGKDFEYVAVFEVYPEIKQVNAPRGEIERLVCQITAADVERTLETMRKQRIRWEPVTRAAQSGDRVEIDFQGTIDGTPFEGGKAEKFPLVLGSHSLIDGFEEGLEGANIGETRTIKTTFPSDYRNHALAGQAVEFTVTVRQVFAPQLPELDAAFFQQLGMVDGSLEKLRAEISGSLQREADNRTQAQLKQALFKALLDANPIELPNGLIDNEARRLVEMMRSNLQAQNVPLDKISSDPTPYKDQARQRVALGLILAEFVKANDIAADPARVRTRIEEMAKGYDSPQEFIQWHYARPERIGEIESLVLEDQAVEVLLKTATVRDKPIDFQQLTQQAK